MLGHVGSPEAQEAGVTEGSDTGLRDGSHGGVTGGLVVLDGIECYRIDGVEKMPPFLMTVVSDTDLWMFVSSTGAQVPSTPGGISGFHRLNMSDGTAARSSLHPPSWYSP
jgi:hypothetical protein